MSLPTSRLPDMFPSMTGECVIAAPPGSRSLGGWLFQLLGLRLRSDEQLMADLQRGETEALTVLFERHGPLVFRVARRVLRNDADAEDAAQQVFLDVFRASPQFDSAKGTFKSWLLMFAYHRTFNLRRRLRSGGLGESPNLDDALPHELMRQRFPVSPVEASILVEEALSLIRPRQRRVIELTYYEGLTAIEISEVTGESVRVVRHNLYRGLEKLRLLLGTGLPHRTADNRYSHHGSWR